MTYMGIDPDQSGAIVMIDDDGDLFAHDLPEYPAEIAKLLRSLTLGEACVLTVIEEPVNVPRRTKMGVLLWPVQQIVKQNRRLGEITAALDIVGMAHEVADPKTWQKVLGVKSKTPVKEQITRWVMRRWPTHRHKLTTQGRRDAAAMAAYAKLRAGE